MKSCEAAPGRQGRGRGLGRFKASAVYGAPGPHTAPQVV
jgi:hypothetical protein